MGMCRCGYILSLTPSTIRSIFNSLHTYIFINMHTHLYTYIQYRHIYINIGVYRFSALCGCTLCVCGCI